MFSADVVLGWVGACPVRGSTEEKREKMSLGRLACF